VWLRGLSVVDRLDPRKKGIVAEDVGLAFAGHAMGLLGALPFMTKWEVGQPDRRSAFAAMLGKAGVSTRRARAAAAATMRGLAGADFVGYSARLGTWVVCESKGTLDAPPSRAEVLQYVADPSIGPIGRRGGPIKTVPYYQYALRQKRKTAGDVAALNIGGVLSIAVLTSLGSEGSGRRTTVDFVDPRPSDDVIEVLSQRGHLVRDLICQAHFEWVADLFDLETELWGTKASGQSTDADWQRDLVVPLPDGELRFRLILDAALGPVLASRSIEELDAYARSHPESPDGLSVTLIEAPQLAPESGEEDEESEESEAGHEEEPDRNVR
jgi:hypothetical protein